MYIEEWHLQQLLREQLAERERVLIEFFSTYRPVTSEVFEIKNQVLQPYDTDLIDKIIGDYMGNDRFLEDSIVDMPADNILGPRMGPIYGGSSTCTTASPNLAVTTAGVVPKVTQR